ncbi:HEAT repeat domain-containing protein [Limnofasciculus baicalensis]|uniref:HEAT repeat domain-containing protein n=1 Tax=Limnofasciculus baicalensis BBK-W-15 TaxID=2699891 RepID=A0AAE3GV54_9CYAN|nr:HEAT repeat domain-containing protein [Limnofasciculus baicalensis]MCP2730944.1 HEAT repeat domain-containing protein [Limnofasciculus baicalensis BBK-W-15]
MIRHIHKKISVSLQILLFGSSLSLLLSNSAWAQNNCTEGKIKENIAKIKDSDSSISLKATYSLAECGSKSVQSIIKTLQQDKDPNIRRDAASALIYMGETAKAAVPQLITSLKQDKDPNVRLSAADALGKMKKSANAAVPQLITSLKQDKDPNVRSSAASALGNMQETGKAAVPQLILSLKQDKDPNVRSNAASALGNMKKIAASAIPELILSLKTDSDIRRNAASSLGNMGETAKFAIPQLLQILQQNKEANIRSAAASALGEMKESAKMTIPQLITALNQDKDISVRTSAAYALRDIASHLQSQKNQSSPSDLEIAQKALDVAKTFIKDEKIIICFPVRFSQNNNSFCLKHLSIKIGLNIWLIHTLIWIGLFCIYPKSPQVQAIFFWNPWMRKIFGLGYIGFAITKIPFLSFHLCSPFKDSLLADGNLDNFDSQAYFTDIEFNLRTNKEAQPIKKPIPSGKFRIVIEGESGVGKSMFMRHLAKFSKRNIVYLLGEKCETGVMEAIQEKLPISNQDPKLLQNLIKNRALDIYIDGFSEMKPQIRVNIASFVKNYSKCNILIATQPLDWLPSSPIKTYILQPLKPQQLEKFLISRQTTLSPDAPISGDKYEEACKNYLASILNQQESEKENTIAIRQLYNPMKLTAIAETIANGKEGGVGFLE